MTASLRRITGGAVNARTLEPVIAIVNRERWMLDGICNQVDPEIFHPTPGYGTAAAAKAICAQCPVMSQCRDYGLDHTEEHGVYGGLAHGERKTLGARRRTMRAIAGDERGAA